MTVETERPARFGNAAARLLAATTLSTFATLPAAAQEAKKQENTTTLEHIVVKTGRFLTRLGGKSKADTGTTTYSGTEVLRLSTDGDANSALKDSANVQYQNEASNNAGSDGQKLISLKPQLLSISGGKVYENNFLVNGVSINTVTGSDEPFGSTELDSYLQTPIVNRVYGLHPQSIFVPSEFVESSTVIDSNASARYGSFLGGVVDYQLKQPSTEKITGSMSFGYQNDDMTTYNLGTEDGMNPNNRVQPKYHKYTASAQFSAPVNDAWSIIGQYSRKGAATTKIKDQRYFYNPADENSDENTLRLASRHDTELGIFTLDTTYMKSSQLWEGYKYKDLTIDVQTRSLATQLRWQRDLDSIESTALGLKNVKFDSRLYHNNSKTVNDGGDPLMISRVILARSATSVTNPALWFTSTDPTLLSWCQVPNVSSWGTAETCAQGGIGWKKQGQKETGAKAEVSGDILAGTFSGGMEYRYTDAYRRFEEAISYGTSVTMLGISAFSGFTCSPGDPTCTAQQYNNRKTFNPAHNGRAYVNSFNTYAELDQTWGMLNLRGGARLDYESYFENVNISPRVVATVTPIDDVSFSAGFNRYFAADSVAYAVRDGQKVGCTATRSHNATGVVGTFGTCATGTYNFKASDVDTPYKDEYTAGLSVTDPLTEGDFRLRFLQRYGRDELMAASGSSSTNVALTNDGESEYRSLTAEYEKSWDTNTAYMDSLGMLASVTWSRQSTTTVSAFKDESDDWYWYRGQSISPEEFDRVRGNLDIPIRSKLDLVSNWMDNRLGLGLTGNLTLGFDGTRDTDVNCTTSISPTATCRVAAGAPGLGKTHNMISDFQYKPVFTLDLTARYKVAELKDTAFQLEMKVLNVFNNTGNKTASADNPWIVGRTVWLGAKATF